MALDSYLLTVRQNYFDKVYRAQASAKGRISLWLSQDRKENFSFSYSLASFAPLRESSFIRFPKPNFNGILQLYLVRPLLTKAPYDKTPAGKGHQGNSRYEDNTEGGRSWEILQFVPVMP